MSELKTNLEQILQEKTTKLIPENIKRKVEIFDVTGTDGDAEVEELQAKIIETRQEIADTRRDLENSAATVTETGENVTLNQTAEATLKKLDIGGNTEQAQYTGKNLLPNIAVSKTEKGITADVRRDGTISIIGTATADFLLDISVNCNLPAGTYIISGCPSGGSVSTYRMLIWDSSWNYVSQDVGNSNEFTFANDTTNNKIAIQILNGTKINRLTFKPMIRLSSITDDSYEPYVGGIPAPNTSYPQEITNVTPINVLNETLFTENAHNGLTWKYDNSSKKIRICGEATSSWSNSKTIELNLPKGTYKFTPFTDSVLLKYNLWLYNSSNTLIGNTKTSNPVTISEEAKYARIFVEDIVSGTTYDEELNVQLEKGTINHNYAPYDCIPIIVQNKNLYDFNNNAPKSYYEINYNTGLMKYTKLNGAFSQILSVNEGEQYTYSGTNNYSGTIRDYIFAVDRDFNYIKDYAWGNSIASGASWQKSFTLPKNSKYLLIAFLDLPDDINPEDCLEIQIEKGLTKTNYVKGKSQKIFFPLNGERLMLEDCLADDGIHRVRKQIVLDGSEDWSIAADYGFGTKYTEESGYIAFRVDINHSWGVKTTINNGNTFSNIAKVFDWFTLQNTPQIGFCIIRYNTPQTTLWVAIPRSVASTVLDFKTFLQNQNMIIENEIEDSVYQSNIIPYTSAQQEVYNEMKKVISYEGQTNVIGSSNGSNPIFTVTAFRDADLAIASLDNQLTLKE